PDPSKERTLPNSARTAGTTTRDIRATDRHDANAAERRTTPVTAVPPQSSVPTASGHMPWTLRHARLGQKEPMACFIVSPKNEH
ncbi:hypothetical protein H634G_11465, partial [Metarhizium anisopliae BRIP 53293]